MTGGRYVLTVLAALAFSLLSFGTGCLPEPYEVGSPDSLFSEFVLVCDLTDQYYACFVASPGIDWDQVFSEHRDQGMRLSGHDDLVSLCLETLGELQDMSICLRDSAGNRHESFERGYFHNWDHDVWLSYMEEWGGPDELDKYGSFVLQEYGDSVGYVYMGTMGAGYSIQEFFDSTVAVRFCSRLILDLRPCDRTGFEYNATYSMGRFTAQSELAYYRSYRTGPGRCDMGPLQPIYATRNGAWQFTGPIVALTGRQTQQAAELLTMLLMTQDHVTVIGDTTSGFANSAQRYNLTGGWTLELPYLATYDTDSVLNFDRSIPPDIYIPVSEADFAAGSDPVLDAALELVLR